MDAQQRLLNRDQLDGEACVVCCERSTPEWPLVPIRGSESSTSLFLFCCEACDAPDLDSLRDLVRESELAINLQCSGDDHE